MKYAKRVGESSRDRVTKGKLYNIVRTIPNLGYDIIDDRGKEFTFGSLNSNWEIVDIPDASECLNAVTKNSSTMAFIENLDADAYSRHEQFLNAIGICFNHLGGVQDNVGFSEDEIRKVLRIPKDMDVIKFCKALRMMADSWIDATK